MVTDVATALKLGEEGVTRTIVHFGKIVPDFHIHVIYASNKIIAAHPQYVREFLAGWFDTIAPMKANKDETVEARYRADHASGRRRSRTKKA